MTPYAYCGPVGHDWQPDPDRRHALTDEGLTCTRCGVTEAELDAMENGGQS
jgi:hypothetical protein